MNTTSFPNESGRSRRQNCRSAAITRPHLPTRSVFWYQILRGWQMKSSVQYSLAFPFQLSAVVDGVYADHSHIAGKFTMLTSSKIHVGGSINTRALPGSRVHNNFIGCMRKVRTFSSVALIFFASGLRAELSLAETKQRQSSSLTFNWKIL